MKKLLILVILFASTAYAPRVFALDLQVSGAGTAAANGCYASYGAGNLGANEWRQGLYAIYTAGVINTDTYCRIGLISGIDAGTGAQLYYYHIGGGGSAVACNTTNATAGAWTTDSGTAPAPTITTTTCPPPATPPIGGATSTTEQAQTNLANGVYIFFLAFFGVVWLFRRRV